MLRRILVANRGEIAARILRACREMGIETVAVFSEADRDALFTKLATQAVCIGGPFARDSYLNTEAILTVAKALGCDGLHPGYGFLSENADFAAQVRESGIAFIGPAPEVIAAMGDKNQARALMRACGVPVVPGSDGLVESVEEALECAARIGYPVLLKASAGGGGHGMRTVEGPEEMAGDFAACRAEAQAAFSSGSLYLEKLIVSPRHVEVQVLADAHGHAIHLGDRDCTLQRSHQKVIEEAPAASIPQEARAAMAAAALTAVRAVGYENAGTVEFVVGADSSFYFIEMNTRIQVEHPVTEMVTGVNIVREQVRIASGLPLGFTQDEIELRGHAIECRINAEDPEAGFAPSPGTIGYLNLPGGFGVRVDSALYPGFVVSPYYDSMIAKIVVLGRTRTEAIFRMRRALEETLVGGIKTNIPLHYMLMYNPDFIANRTDTGFIERNLESLLAPLGQEGEL